MSEDTIGRILMGDETEIRRSYERSRDQPIDHEWIKQPPGKRPPRETTLERSFTVSGPGTFLGVEERALRFEPTKRKGWWFDRQDLPDSMPIRVSVDNVWTTVRNIVLSSGSPHNYMRMVEHIIALKVGLDIDNVMIRMDSGDPPLFNRSSLGLVEAAEDEAGIVGTKERAAYVTVKEPVTIGGRRGSFLTFLPADSGSNEFVVDCVVDFRTAIGKERILFTVDRETFRHGSFARTNCPLWQMLMYGTAGKLLADIRNLGYTKKNILVAGPRNYCNEPRLMHGGKSLEPCWHRATLDLLAAVALIDRGRFAGKIISHKSGHALDVMMIRELYDQDLFCAV